MFRLLFLCELFALFFNLVELCSFFVFPNLKAFYVSPSFFIYVQLAYLL